MTQEQPLSMKNKHALSVCNTKLHNEGGRPLHRELQEYGDTSRPCNFMWKHCEQQYWSMPESRYALVCATREWTLPSLVWKACLQRVNSPDPLLCLLPPTKRGLVLSGFVISILCKGCRSWDTTSALQVWAGNSMAKASLNLSPELPLVLSQ